MYEDVYKFKLIRMNNHPFDKVISQLKILLVSCRVVTASFLYFCINVVRSTFPFLL